MYKKIFRIKVVVFFKFYCVFSFKNVLHLLQGGILADSAVKLLPQDKSALIIQAEK